MPPAKGIEKIYFTLDISPSQRLMLFRQVYSGKRYLHLRTWFQLGPDEEFQSGKGVVLPMNPVVLHELADAIHELADDFPWEGGSGFPADADNTSERVEPDDPEAGGNQNGE